MEETNRASYEDGYNRGLRACLAKEQYEGVLRSALIELVVGGGWVQLIL